MRTLPETAVFTTAQAHAHGWTPDTLAHAVRTGCVFRLRHGVYSGAEPTVLDRAVAAALVRRDAVISHRSAALLHGLPVVGRQPEPPEITVPPRASANGVTTHLHRAGLRPHDVVELRGVNVTSVARTVVDVARHRPVPTAVALGDAALQRGLCDPESIRDVLDHCSVWPRIARARRSLALVDARAESPLESVSRLVLRRHSVPAPALQTVVCTAWGAFVARVDFYWDEYGVVGEADGRAKYDTRDVLTREKQRQEELENMGLVVVRWGWDEAWRRPGVLVDRIARAFERGQARDRSDFPRKWVL